MDPTLIAVIVVVVLAVAVGALAMRRGGENKALPKEQKPELEQGEQQATAREGPEQEPSREAQAPAREPEAPQAAAEAAPAHAPSAAAEAPAKAEEGQQPAPESPQPTEQAAEAAYETAPQGEPERKGASKEEIAELKKGLASTRGGFISRLAKLFGRKKEIDPSLLEEIEEVLVTADIGVSTTQKILGQLRERLQRDELSDPDAVWKALREEARAILGESPGGIDPRHKPTVVLVVGVNGTGKTTTIGKLASRYVHEGKKVVLAAGDTFRAAAVLQLEVWGRKVGCDLVKGKERADPGSVVFDAIKKAQQEEADVVLVDTAGRLHTKAPLMEELKKVGRTTEKALGRPADETLLVLDSTTGQNAIQQAQMFKEALPLTGIVLTKLDGTAKGGVILGIVDEHGVPVRYIGIGERVEDLREFDAASFVEALFTKPDDEPMAA